MVNYISRQFHSIVRGISGVLEWGPGSSGSWGTCPSCPYVTPPLITELLYGYLKPCRKYNAGNSCEKRAQPKVTRTFFTRNYQEYEANILRFPHFGYLIGDHLKTQLKRYEDLVGGSSDGFTWINPITISGKLLNIGNSQ